MGRGARALLAVASIAALTFISVWTVRAGLANSLALAAERRIGGWWAAGVRPENDAWVAVRESLLRAEGLSPADPAVPELLGVMHLLRWPRLKSAEQALEHFTRALALRPSWPNTWASVIEVRFRLGLTQPPFERMLIETQRLGPSEPAVQREVVELGMVMWDRLGVPAREAVDTAIGAAMRRNPEETLAIAARRRQLPLACPYVPGDPRLAQSKWPAACGG